MAKKQRAAELRRRQRETQSASTRSKKRPSRRIVQRKNTGWWWIGGIVLLCVIAIGAFILTSNNQQQAANQKAAGNINAGSATVLKEVTSVPASVRSAVNTGGLTSIVTPVTGKPALTGSNGKPEFFYYGAEWCPYCAANRWSMIVALSQFGTFKQLPETLSSSSDIDPNTPTFTFVNTGYTSPYIDFVPLENQDRNHNTIETPTAAQQSLLTSFNVQGYPFLDIGNKFQTGALYDPAVLANLSQAQVASKLSDPTDTITQNIVGAANYLTAAICSVTNNQPGSVCTQAPIPTLQSTISQGQSSTHPSSPQNALASTDEQKRSL
jgi:hypothetical protein